MASIQVLIMCLSLFALSQLMKLEVESTSSISRGSSLQPNTNRSSWLSPSGHFAFGFYPQGNGFTVGIWLVDSHDSITVVWTYRNEPPVLSNSTIEFTNDGELLLRTGQDEGQTKIIAYISRDEEGDSALMSDSGNFLIYNNNSEVIWQSFNNPTDTLLEGQSMFNRLVSSQSTSDHSRGNFCLRLVGSSGGPLSLVAYPANHTDRSIPEEIYWERKCNESTYSGRAGRLNLTGGVLQLTRGNLTLQVIADISYKSVMNETLIYRATLDADGILRLYLHHFKIDGSSNVTSEWSALQNRCEVKGFCGFNSYCASNSSGEDCHCFDGFDYIDRRMRTMGCSRNFSDEQGCYRKDPAQFYRITNMEKTKLGGLAYSVLEVNKENCKKSCLEDCYCGAAYYANGTCRRLGLPLMFGMKGEDESGTVFIKWSSQNGFLSIPTHTPPPGTSLVVVESKKDLIRNLGASLGSITFLCFLIAIYSYLVYKIRVLKYEKLPANSKLGLKQEFTALKSFSYNELVQATGGFDKKLSASSFGAVYKGTINDGEKTVAVKRLENFGEDGERKFRVEMAAVRQTHHRNLVRLLGFCIEGSKKLLVYEYMSKGSLADFLFNVEKRPLWKERVRIALDVAKGILYLHEECEVQIVHCNIRPKNILIDDYGTAKISNFGLANILMPIQTETASRVKGTRGYMAPEWQQNALISIKSDVYSFGIVLLEIICCRSNIEVNVATANEMLLSTWVYECFVAGELDKLVQEEEVDMKSLERMVKVGLLCVQDDQTLRPSMKSVILMLEGTMDVPLPPFPTTHTST